ncbi:mitochondrial import inner membrane translocase subunit TIM44-like [Actinia tenebrosa]|uniref:Mitochondrial import inner membrane translocase subunit TIM44 n=1 Tax=Actinia tenebrosa TaxID=6105 RepID=A0A6P8I7J6_ACTTE|nr:mitochondrial import inner membrane translocase subunit TIM44-like [Actinia tenebrosa]
MAQASISRYFCQSCGYVSRCHGVVVPRGSSSRSCGGRSWMNIALIEKHHNQQVRNFAYRRPDEQPGLFGRFIQNIKEGFERNKEMQENIKKFKKQAEKFEKSDTLKTAKSRFELLDKAKDKFSDASTKISSTARSVSGSAATKVTQAYEEFTKSDTFKKGREASEELSKSAQDAASKIKEQSDELSKTAPFKTVSTGFKVVKEEVLDEEFKQSRPYQTPAELRRRTEASKREGMEKERRLEADEDTTGMVLHKDSKWYQQWQEFKDNNPVVNGLFSLKMKYDESDNLFVRATRVVTDKVGDIFSDVFSQSEMAKTLSEITKIDPQFNKDKFLQECEFEIIPAVLEAFLKGNLELLKDWCHEPAYNVLSAQIEQIKQVGQKLDAKLLDIRDVDLAMAKIMEQGPVLVLTFNAQQIMVLRDATGTIIEGGEDNIESVSYVWALCRDQSILEHRQAWRVLEFGIQNSTAWV